MLKIILSRKGKKKQAYFRLIVCEKTKDPWGSYLENLGSYNPRSKEMNFKIDRIKHWISKGAQPSATVWNMLVTKGVVEGKKKKISLISKRRKNKISEANKVKEEAAALPTAPANPS